MSMYKFVDTTKAASAANTLPSEALSINGKYIENQITGYRTLSVSGREAFSPEILTYETGIRDGSKIQSRRFPARTIKVNYQIIAKDNAAFRDAFNKLGGILNVKDAKLIFYDEKDKYFIGTPSFVDEIEPGSNAVTGTFEILCNDPFKYSTTQTEVEAVDDEFTIDYVGTHKSFPVLEVDFYSEDETDGENETALTGNGDCGYVAFYNSNGKIIQLGDPEEEDIEKFAKSQTLVNQSFKKSTSWGTASKKLWALNVGVASSDIYEQTGSMKADKSFSDATTSQYYLTANSYGSGAKYHGPTITRTIPKDASGTTGAANFTFSYKQKISIGSDKKAIEQCGSFQAMLTSGSGSSRKIIAGVAIWKSGSGKKGHLRMYVNNKVAYTRDIDLSYNNKMFGNNSTEKNIQTVKDTIITKTGGTISFNVGGLKKVFKNSDIADTKVTQITFGFYKFGTKSALSFNGLYNAKFIKNNCQTWRDIPNKFSANDELIANCKNGTITLNGTETPEYGALGNDWEDFYLSPGTNSIGVSYSDWVTDAYKPTFKIRYREVYL